MIKISNVSLQRGTKLLLEHANLTIFPGQKWGVIGKNGCGKSSLFKLLLKQVSADQGNCDVPGGWAIAHMAQEITATEQSALAFVLSGDEPLCLIEKAIEEAEGQGEKLAQLYAELEKIDGYSARARALKLIAGLGFKPGSETQTVASFSGGWRIRLNLARALMCRSDLLLLDEPTNHLDMDATLWLEQWLKTYPGTLLMISHDRDFLDNTIQHIVHFEAQQLQSYTGTYSSFEKQSAERKSQQQALFEKQQQRKSDIEDFVRRFRAKASKAKQAQSRLKELERMQSLAPAYADSPFQFAFPEPENIPEHMLSLSDAGLGYQGQTLLNAVNTNILGASRIGLLGHNGAGKSTLLKTLASQLPVLSGELTYSPHLKIGYFAQHQIEQLDDQASGLLHLQRMSPTAREQDLRNFLGSFGFIGDAALAPVEPFSGGEKARLALALLAWQKPNLLLLDEPTNHLDLQMRQALNEALQQYEGSIVLISHDRHLLRHSVDEFWLVQEGKVVPFEGDLQDYYDQVLKSDGVPSSKSVVSDKKQARQDAAALRQRMQPFTRLLKKLEKQMADIQVKLEKLDIRLADEALYQGASEELTQLLKEQGGLKQALGTAEAEWFSVSEELETLQSSL